MQLIDLFDRGLSFGAQAPCLVEPDGRTLSYGDQRRVEMMRALALKPEVLLLDEPVAGINEVEAAKLGEIFRKLATEGAGMAVLLIEHNMRFVTDLCDYVYVLDSGILISQGSAQKVVNDPVVVKAYLGDDEDA